MSLEHDAETTRLWYNMPYDDRRNKLYSLLGRLNTNQLYVLKSEALEGDFNRVMLKRVTNDEDGLLVEFYHYYYDEGSWSHTAHTTLYELNKDPDVCSIILW